MSALAARSAPSTRSAAPARGAMPRVAHLAPVAAPSRQASLLPFVLLCVGLIVGALVAVLLLNTAMTSQAYERQDLRLEQIDLADQRAALLTALDAQAAPQHLAAAARALGMRPATEVGFISLTDGTVVQPGDGGA